MISANPNKVGNNKKNGNDHDETLTLDTAKPLLCHKKKNHSSCGGNPHHIQIKNAQITITSKMLTDGLLCKEKKKID